MFSENLHLLVSSLLTFEQKTKSVDASAAHLIPVLSILLYFHHNTDLYQRQIKN
jgi:hypothetical protein